jgi:glutathione peroxidase
MTRLADFQVRTTEGEEVDLAAYDGRVVLVVNTASQCGYASQLPGLQRLHERYADRGFAVLGFPSDQFKQEPLADEEVGAVCQRTHGVSFPIFAKVKVNGRETHPLYQWLRSQKKGVLGARINWNFTKFLVDREGAVVGRYGPSTDPAQITGDIEKLLAA